MSAESTVFPATKTVRAWNEPIKADPRVLFNIMSQALVTLKKKEWEDLGRRTVKAFSPEGWAGDPAQMGYVLFWRALFRASFDLSRELALWLSWLDPEDSEAITAGLDYSFEDKPLTIEVSSFLFPKSLPLLKWIKKPFKQWLIGQGLTEGRAGPALERLDSYFAVGFYRQWFIRRRDYTPLAQTLGPPFAPDGSMKLAWSAYYARLEKQTRAPHFNEDTFDDSQVYVPLRAYRLRTQVEDPKFKELSEYLYRRREGLVKEVVDLEEAVTGWIHDDGAPSDFCLIASTPGSGEGMFNKILADRLAKDEKVKVLLVPLRELDLSEGLDKGLDSLFVRQGIFPRHPVKEPFERLVVIFEKLGHLAGDDMDLADKLQSFLLQVVKFLEIHNQDKRRLLAVITGFDSVIGIIKDDLPRTVSVYHILPLFISESNRQDYVDPENLLPVDQREHWWRLYGRATGRDYPGLPDELRGLGGNFNRLTANPAHNYMAACAWEQDRVRFTEETSSSDLAYDQIMLTYDRIYDEKKPYCWLFQMKPSRYRSVLKEIAVMSWHSRGKTARLRVMKERFERFGLAPQLKAFTELAQAGALSYLRYVSGPGKEESLTFPYRGMPNYLVARRIFNELQVLDDEFRQRSEFAFRGLDDEAALRRWAALCGPSPFNPQILGFLIETLQSEASDSASAWQKMVCRLLEWTARYGLPFANLPGNSNEIMACARNAEEALLICHYGCALVTEEKGEIAWPDKTAAGRWIRRLCGQETKGFRHLTARCLGYLNLSNCILDGLDLRGSNLVRSLFKNSSLNYACLAGADLHNANLTQASLSHSNLTEADLRRVYMRQADLNQAILRRADLREADLSRASLREADLGGADLRWTDLREADLRKADLKGADLRWAYLEGTDLRGTDLRGADLRETDPRLARLEGADLTWADLDHNDLKIPTADLSL